MEQREADLLTVSEHWAQTPEQLRGRALIAWMEHDHVKRYINRRATGSPTDDWLSCMLRRYCQSTAGRALSLGCGVGGLERHALVAGHVTHFDAYDASHGAVQTAREAAREAGLSERVRYEIADLNTLELGRAEYDRVFASMSVHHVRELEHLFTQVRKALRPGGLWIMNEYVGATRFQVPPVQCDLINDVLKILPARFRRLITNGEFTDAIKERYTVIAEEQLIAVDPSEAVRSGDIMRLLREYFEIINVVPYGGSVLHFLLENIVGNFDDNREEDRSWLDMLEYLEETVERAGLLPSDFAIVVVANPI